MSELAKNTGNVFTDGSGNLTDREGRLWSEVLGTAAHAAVLASLRQRKQALGAPTEIANEEAASNPYYDSEFGVDWDLRGGV